MEALAVFAVVAAVGIVVRAFRKRTAWNLFFASVVFFVGAGAWLVVTPIFLWVLANPPSCQDGPCGWDEAIDGPTPLRAQQWFIESIWFGGAAALLVTAIALAVAAVGAQHRSPA